MKIAVSGKGGVGKSTVAAALALLTARQGRKVLAVDADPDANLAAALGMPEELLRSVVPIAQRRALIEERTGAKVREYGQMFKLNPDVSDIADRFALTHNGVSLLVLGAAQQGGGGCACPENVLIRGLVADLILHKKDALIMDMEAGVEHLGRATAQSVDTLLVVLEPGQRSVDSAHRIIRMAGEIGLKDIRLAANKLTGEDDERFLVGSFPEREFLGMIPYCEDLRRVDRNGLSVLDKLDPKIVKVFERILEQVS